MAAAVTPLCTRCGRPTGDMAYLCTACTERLQRALGDIPALAEELDTTRTRQSRLGTGAIGVVSRSASQPLPWQEHASQAERALKVELVGWVRVMLDERGGRLPADTLAALSRSLLAAVQWWRHQPMAGEIAGGVARTVAVVRNAVDRAPDSRYIGRCSARTVVDLLDCDCCDHTEPCGDCEPAHRDARIVAVCPTDLYARDGAESVRCQCGAVHNVAERRATLLAAVDDVLATIGEIVPAVSSLVRPVPAATIRSWVRRGRLLDRGATADGQALYRIGDVLDLLAGQDARAAS